MPLHAAHIAPMRIRPTLILPFITRYRDCEQS